MGQCNMTFDLKINLGHSDLYFMVQWFLLFFALKNILVLLAKLDSGELRCPATALINLHFILFFYLYLDYLSWWTANNLVIN